jgi:hypothetical protein
MPLNLHEDAQEAKASVPNNDPFVTATDSCRVDDGPGLAAGQLKKDNAGGNSNLRSSDCPPISGCSAPMRKSIAQILN